MIKVGDYEVDETRIPDAIKLVYLQRALSHVFNNECDSAMLSRIRREIVGEKGKLTDATEDAVTAFRAANETAIAAWSDEWCATKIAAIYDGTIGVRAARGPVRDPVEAEARRLAAAFVFNAFKSAGMAFPKGSKTLKDDDTEYATADATKSGAEWIDHVLASAHGDGVRKEATRIVRERQREREFVTKGAAALFAPAPAE